MTVHVDPLVLTLDAGGGGCRASLYDRRGERVAHAHTGWCAHVPPDLAPFGREYNVGTLRDAIHRSIRFATSGLDTTRIAGLCCTGQRIACAFVDERGETIYAGPNGDVRALAGGDLSGLDDDVLYTRTGRLPPWVFAPGRLRWFEAVHPALFRRIRHVLGLPSWIAFELTGVAATDATLAADLMMLDVATRSRTPPSSGLPDHVWPEVRGAAQLLGRLLPEAAARVGLPVGVPVAVGCADTQGALLFSPGDALIAGSTAPLVRPVSAPERDPTQRTWLDPAVESGFCLEANLGELGSAHLWLMQLLALPSFDAFDALARQAPPGSRGASAHLGPRAMNLRDLNTARPAALLLPFGETSLASPPGRAEIARSFLESCAFAVHAGRRWLEEIAAPSPEMCIFGGLRASTLFADILASVLETPVLRGPGDETARAAAACAWVAADLEPSLARAVELMSRPLDRHLPERDYEDALERWLEREEQLEEM